MENRTFRNIETLPNKKTSEQDLLSLSNHAYKCKFYGFGASFHTLLKLLEF